MLIDARKKLLQEAEDNCMTKIDKSERVEEIKELVQAFCNRHLNEELAGYALKLCDKIGRKRTLSIICFISELYRERLREKWLLPKLTSMRKSYLLKGLSVLIAARR